MVVRHDETVRRDERRAAAAEGHDRSHRLAREVGESLRVAPEAHRVEAVGELRDLLGHPFPLVGARGGGEEEEREDVRDASLHGHRPGAVTSRLGASPISLRMFVAPSTSDIVQSM